MSLEPTTADDVASDYLQTMLYLAAFSSSNDNGDDEFTYDFDINDRNYSITAMANTLTEILEM